MFVPDRVYGLETEFGVMKRLANGAFWNLTVFPDPVFNDLVWRTDPRTHFHDYDHGQKIWHLNGSTTYMDINNHPEHATPECRSVRDLVAYCKAGENLAVNIFSKDLGNGSDIILYKNNIGWDELSGFTTTWGCHDNYSLYTIGASSAFLCSQLTAFLITRQMFDGAGWWDLDGAYHLSQRANMIDIEFGVNSTTSRPIVHHKSQQEDTGERLHLILGDSNILEAAHFLKVGTTAAVLALMEAELCPKLLCSAPVSILRQISACGDLGAKIVTFEDGSRLTPLEVQSRYLEAAREHLLRADYQSEKTEAEMGEILKLWGAALDALYSGDKKWMVGRLDHATKYFLAERELARASHLPPSEQARIRKDIDILYHDMTDRRLRERMNKQWRSSRIVSDADIEHAMENPPSDTRARIRGEFISTMLALPHPYSHPLKARIFWNCIEFPAMRISYRFPDPLMSKDNEWENKLKEILTA